MNASTKKVTRKKVKVKGTKGDSHVNKATRDLTEHQEKFCFDYVFVNIGDEDAAYKAAGYSNKNPYEIHRKAKNLLSQDNIKERILDLQGERNDRKVMDKCYILTGLKTMIEDKDTSDSVKHQCYKTGAQILGIMNQQGEKDKTKETTNKAREAVENRLNKKKELEEGKNLLNFQKKEGTDG